MEEKFPNTTYFRRSPLSFDSEHAYIDNCEICGEADCISIVELLKVLSIHSNRHVLQVNHRTHIRRLLISQEGNLLSEEIVAS